jgi:hypothetical protein
VQGAEASADGTPLGIGGPVSSAWREELLMRAQELRGLRGWIMAHGNHDPRATELLGTIDTHLGAVTDTAVGKHGATKRLFWGVTGASFERTLGNLDAVEVDLLRLAPSSVLIPALPSLLAHINRYLSKDDPRRQAVEHIARDQEERVGRDPGLHGDRGRADPDRRQIADDHPAVLHPGD